MDCTSLSEIHVKTTAEDIIQHLINNKDVYFKSQQIDEEELSSSEKEHIARSILDKNKSNFLSRFGKHLKLEHLDYFKQFLNENSDAEDHLLNYHYHTLLRYHTKSVHAIDVRNRRYEAWKKLIVEDSYFSEIEMMKRNPLLYEQLIGRYLSEKEIKLRDNIDKKNITFVNLLMEGIERDMTEDRRKKQKIFEEIVMDEDSNSGVKEHNCLGENTKNGPFAKIEWSKFAKERNDVEEEEEDTEEEDEMEDNAPICEEMKVNIEPEEIQTPQNMAMETEITNGDCTMKKFTPFRISPKKLEKSKKPAPLINGHITHRKEMRVTAIEVKKSQELAKQCMKWGEYENVEEIRPWKRKEVKVKIEDMLVSTQERLLMKQEFISLMYQSFLDGKDDFDYSTVDFNEEYDNTDILEQDAEEKYFESESPNEDEIIEEKKSMECLSDDELDVFMERLNQHPTICQLSNDMKNL